MPKGPKMDPKILPKSVLGGIPKGGKGISKPKRCRSGFLGPPRVPKLLKIELKFIPKWVQNKSKYWCGLAYVWDIFEVVFQQAWRGFSIVCLYCCHSFYALLSLFRGNLGIDSRPSQFISREVERLRHWEAEKREAEKLRCWEFVKLGSRTAEALRS